MPKRQLLILILAFMPLTATAGEAQTTAAPADLGPPSTTAAGGSNADAGALQPAGTTPLQSTTDSSAGLTAPSNLLQGSNLSGDALKVLDGEADGPPHHPTTPSTDVWSWLWLVLAFGAIGTAVVLRDRRRFRDIAP